MLVHSRDVHPRVREAALQMSGLMVKEEDGRVIGLMGLSLEYKEVGQRDAGLITHFTAL